MAYIVARHYSRHGTDYLCEWDVIWGPVWTGMVKHAARFDTQREADVALFDAMDIMRPKAWCVPNYGSRLTLETVAAA